MSELVKMVVLLAVLFGVIGVVWLVLARLGLLNAGAGSAAAEKGATKAAYRTREWVQSPGERAFAPVLEEAVRMVAAERQLPTPRVLACVRLAEVVEPVAKQATHRSGWQSAFNRIQAKQADFVVCEPESMRPLMVVELDDRTHGRADRKARDGVVDDVCRSAGLPIVHVAAASKYDARRIAGEIGAKLGGRA